MPNGSQAVSSESHRGPKHRDCWSPPPEFPFSGAGAGPDNCMSNKVASAANAAGRDHTENHCRLASTNLSA